MANKDSKTANKYYYQKRKGKKPGNGRKPGSGKDQEFSSRGKGGSSYGVDDDVSFKGKKGDAASDIKHKFNDVSWYAKNKEMLQDAASWSYNTAIGYQIPFNTIYDAPAGKNFDYEGSYSIPGIYVLGYIPGVGLCTESDSPANLAAQNIYSYVRYMNSGAKNYDAPDLMMYLLAMDSLYIMFNSIKRVLGMTNLYSQYSRYLPRALVTACGVDFDDLIANEANYRRSLNNLAADLTSFCVPNVMPLFIRHSWLTSNVYKDSDILKSQLFLLMPNYVYMYNETGSETGGMLEPLEWMSPQRNANSVGLLKLSSFLAGARKALQRVLLSEDIGVMSGDIMKAYGSSNLFKLEGIDENYSVEPVYNEEVLNQIHNSTLVNAANYDVTNVTLNITQTANGTIIFNPTFPAEQIEQYGALINMPWDNVTPENTMVGTRLTAMRKTSSTAGKDQFAALGSEFINQRHIVYVDQNGVLQYPQIGNNIVINKGTVGMADAKLFSYISNFDWHPLMPILIQDGDTLSFCGMMGDVSNYTLKHQSDFEAIHRTAILSELNIPQLGSF